MGSFFSRGSFQGCERNRNNHLPPTWNDKAHFHSIQQKSTQICCCWSLFCSHTCRLTVRTHGGENFAKQRFLFWQVIPFQDINLHFSCVRPQGKPLGLHEKRLLVSFRFKLKFNNLCRTQGTIIMQRTSLRVLLICCFSFLIQFLTR